ncbi:hypothetical protein C2G38_2239602 [Gigaspora rosea]|uniref:Uncharacterized protein n=1 Tax=Gigaspora rosea TaxID=44941 RepID=A0A397W9S9_9GLOM|nr:hypothetical protein C2G38_2239602 [Gigaspora rosea]
MEYFTLIPYDLWTLKNFICFIVGCNKDSDKNEVTRIFYSGLEEINANINAPQGKRDRARKLLDNKEADCNKVEEIWTHINERKTSLNL